jgi:predicted alpha/beta-fold hydrolase
MQSVTAAGWVGVVMNFRSCSGRLNRAPRLYHSGETGDAGFFINWLTQQFPSAPLYAVGFSLGGNMLLKLAGEQGNNLILKALVSVSAPVKLSESTRYMLKGLPRLYQAYLLKALKRKFLDKYPYHDYKSLIDVERQDVINCKDIREFDHIITARLHGFTGAEDYYQQSSAYPYIERIEKPCLIIHAHDDPIAPSFILPQKNSLPHQVELQVTAHGGHVGFLGGTILQPNYWLSDRIMDYFKQQQQQD